MFFLGGFHTILPHLLYLGLIWIFMIAGFIHQPSVADIPEKKPATFDSTCVQGFIRDSDYSVNDIHPASPGLHTIFSDTGYPPGFLRISPLQETEYTDTFNLCSSLLRGPPDLV